MTPLQIFLARAYSGVAESQRHRTMKQLVRRELEEESYSVIEEPLWPPSRRLHWSRYRPDLLGYRRTDGSEELAVVECETHPGMKRFRAKNYRSVWFQSSLLADGRVRRILAVPKGRLKSVDMRLRDQWEIWVLGDGVLEKIGTSTALRP